MGLKSEMTVDSLPPWGVAEPAKAEPLYRRVLALKEKLLGPDHVEVALTLSNLAALCHAQGRTTEAAALYQRALAIGEPALGPHHPGVLAWREDDAVLRQGNPA